MQRGSRIGIALCAALGVALATGSARADERWDPVSQRNAAGVDFRLVSARVWGTSIGLVPFAQYEVVPQVFLDASLPLALGIGGSQLLPSGGSFRAAVGNPTIGAHYATTTGPLTLFGGAHVSLPLASFHGRAYQLADTYASFALADYDAYLYLPEYLPITGTLGLEWRVAEPLYVRASTDPMLLIATSGRDILFGGGRSTIFATQHRVEVEGRSSAIDAGGGVALTAVVQWTSASGASSLLNRDRAQLGLEPFLGYDDGKLFGRLGAVLALDEPLGFAFDRSSRGAPKIATLHVVFGARLP